ncbi:hypothetical protein AF335_04980 [Streptomyces eurocidicus]|uniref:Uncharacterized protein n=1 Tax=Streptomyces eurocidicus TaxID=66423 RepID=A0A2N8NZ36_STREU|nr:hypothetical protein [Streptomyces eurocidicus]MBB5122753.1 hypothetical protein [Streptomyces eurocidicus]MBF6055202.1 hypothetical protein [Streptomyces eurocidicus]PNE34036.1 hypothetical protein AF335_04980 [Streptomyces eurocidicus]
MVEIHSADGERRRPPFVVTPEGTAGLPPGQPPRTRSVFDTPQFSRDLRQAVIERAERDLADLEVLAESVSRLARRCRTTRS